MTYHPSIYVYAMVIIFHREYELIIEYFFPDCWSYEFISFIDIAHISCNNRFGLSSDAVVSLFGSHNTSHERGFGWIGQSHTVSFSCSSSRNRKLDAWTEWRVHSEYSELVQFRGQKIRGQQNRGRILTTKWLFISKPLFRPLTTNLFFSPRIWILLNKHIY